MATTVTGELTGSGAFPVYARQVATQSVDTQVTPQDATNLTISCTSGNTYQFDAFLMVEIYGATTGGYRFDFTGPTVSALNYSWSITTALTTFNSSGWETAFGTDFTGSIAVSGRFIAVCRGSFIATSTANLQLRFAQNTSDADAIELARGSYLKVQQI